MTVIWAKRLSLTKNNYPSSLWILFILSNMDTPQCTLPIYTIKWVSNTLSHCLLSKVMSMEQEGSTVGYPYSLIEWDEFYLVVKKEWNPQRCWTVTQWNLQSITRSYITLCNITMHLSLNSYSFDTWWHYFILILSRYRIVWIWYVTA